MHPTILIGYGEYGRRCLQTLLANAAARGVLPWEENPGLFAERRLDSLALFWVPDPLQPASVESAFDGRDNFEMMEDLYRQIETVEARGAQPGAALAQAVEETKQRLFAEHKLTANSGLTLGLDVMVLARVSDAGTVGKLSEVLSPVMEKLASDPGFRAIEGQDLLNFLQLLDFDDFWGRSPRQAAVREALSNELERAREAAQHKRPAFGRVYLFDGRTERGNHDASQRMAEAVLFLEFLLFDGHRGVSSLRTFYVREPNAPALCTLGIRTVEFSTARLRRLAAASFSRGWLNYLGGGGSAIPENSAIAAQVRPFLPPALENTLGRASLDTDIGQALLEIEDELLRLDPVAADWPVAVEQAATDLTAARKAGLASRAADLGRAVVKQHIAPLPEALRHAITESLSDDSFPRTTGNIAREVRELIERLQTSASSIGDAPSAGSSPEPAVSPEAFARVHSDYLDLRDRQLDPARLRPWWPLFALGASLAFYPMWRDLGQELLGDDWLPAGWQTLTYLLTLLLLLTGIAWRVFHPWLERAVARPRDFFTHRERGRLSALVRRKVRGADVETVLRASAQETIRAQRQRLAGEVCGQLQQVVRPLAERQREIRWLANQLEGYLRLHGVEERADFPRFYANRETPPVCYALETNAELQNVAAAHPAREAQYSHVQRQLKIFNGWQERFSRTFLDPHRFLDEVAAVFPSGIDETRLAAGWDPLESTCRHASLSIL